MCDKCNDTGKIVNETGPGPVCDVGGGYTIQRTGGSASDLCECRKSLPPRHGKARWWQCETVYSESMTTCDGFGQVNVTISREVPISEDNYRLHRTVENAYFSCTPTVEIESGPALTSGALRDIAAFLIRMAAKTDELDQPHPSP